MTTYLVRARDGIHIGATGLRVARGRPVTDGMIGNFNLVKAMAEEGVIEEISNLKALALDTLCKLPGIYPQLAEALMAAGIPSEADLQAAEKARQDPRLATLRALLDAPAERLIEVPGIGDATAERIQNQARQAALRIGS